VQSKPIKKGVSVKDNVGQYTFLCQNCMANSSLAFDPKADKVDLSFVAVRFLGLVPPHTSDWHSQGHQAPSNHALGTALVAHTDRSTLHFSINLSAARSENYSKWAKMAEDPAPCK
jgi:hypothetical protein